MYHSGKEPKHLAQPSTLQKMKMKFREKVTIWDTLGLKPKASDFPMSIVDLSRVDIRTQIINNAILIYLGNSFKFFVFLIFIGVNV